MELYGPKGHTFIKEMGKKMADLGFFRIPVPESAGGLGAPRTTLLVVYEELSKESPALALHLMLNGVLPTMLLMGMPAAREKWFEKVLDGEATMAGAGTDPRGLANFSEWSDLAVRDGDHFILNGSRSYCTGGPYADLVIVFGLYKGTTWAFPLDVGTPGLIIREDEKMGLGTSFGALTMSDVRVPVAESLEMSAWVKDRKLVQANGHSTINVLDISSMSLGLAEGVFEKTFEYALQRTNAGKSILTLGAIQVKFAKMKAQIECARNMIYNAARLLEEGRQDKMLEHMVKPIATEMAVDVARSCMQLHGGMGYCVETGIERYLRDAMGLTIGECTSDMHWSTVATLMDMPETRLGSF
jgi:alkylation response protein AidB-like acyl-CoA dehydrogenase